MKKAVCVLYSLVLCVTVWSCLPLFTGCETAEGLQGIEVQPASVTLTPGTNTVTFTAVLNATNTLSFPLEWTVSDPSLGSIVSSSGDSAVYQSSDSHGENIVTVRDQYGNEGYATVDQQSGSYTYSLTLTASPGTTLTATNNTCTITVEGGVAPYDWWVSDPSLGSIISEDEGGAVVYQSTAAGANAVNVEDDNGVSSSIGVTQTAEPEPAPEPGPAD